MGKSGHDFILSSSHLTISLPHLALTYQFPALPKFRRKVLSNNGLLITSTNHNTSDWWKSRDECQNWTKIPSHIRRKWPGLKLNACMTYSKKRHEVSSQLTFPLYSSFCFSVAWKLSVFIQRQSWMLKSFRIKPQFWIKLTSFLRQLPQCQAIFSEQFSLPIRRSQKWGFAN